RATGRLSAARFAVARHMKQQVQVTRVTGRITVERMIKALADRHTQERYATGKSKRIPADMARRAARKLEYVDLAKRLDDLKIPPGNRLHGLEGNRKGQHSISINDQWRIC